MAGATFCHWDLWFAAVAVADHTGSLDALESQLVGELGSFAGSRRCTEAKLSHLFDLSSRLGAAGLAPADLATAEVLADTRVMARARKKVGDTSLEGRAMTDAMVETPRVRLVRRARTGRWGAFPVDPARYYASFRRHVEVREHVSKYKSFTVVGRIEALRASLDGPSLSAAERLALMRAFHTAALELADRTDDSHGTLGEARRDAWHTYLELDWQEAGVHPRDYWADVCDLVVFEPYGLDFREETLPWQRVAAGQVGIVSHYLLDLSAECRSEHLDDPADAALEQLAWLLVAGERVETYVEAAVRLGTGNWIPIEALATSALACGRRDVAIEVFSAADRPGFHQEYLRERCLALTGVDVRRDDGRARHVGVAEGPEAAR